MMSRVLIAALVILTATRTSDGQGIIAPTAGPINRSMSGASVAAPVDFGASYWNPPIISGLPPPADKANSVEVMR
jgi:long-chain fatty acid transport protein